MPRSVRLRRTCRGPIHISAPFPTLKTHLICGCTYDMRLEGRFPRYAPEASEAGPACFHQRRTPPRRCTPTSSRRRSSSSRRRIPRDGATDRPIPGGRPLRPGTASSLDESGAGRVESEKTTGAATATWWKAWQPRQLAWRLLWRSCESGAGQVESGPPSNPGEQPPRGAFARIQTASAAKMCGLHASPISAHAAPCATAIRLRDGSSPPLSSVQHLVGYRERIPSPQV